MAQKHTKGTHGPFGGFFGGVSLLLLLLVPVTSDQVKIENITEVGVRRLEGGRRLATVAYLEVRAADSLAR